MKSSEVLSAPVTVNWSLSYACNFSCSHCYSRNMETATPALGEILQTVDLLAEKGVVFVNFGGGEPLLLPFLYEVAGHAASRGLKVSMNSNGWLLDRGEADRIARAGFASVGISIDSPEASVHDRFRNRDGSFQRAVRALDHLAASGVRSTVSCVVNRLNFNHWRGMIPLCRDHGAGTLYLHNYKCSGMGLVNMGDLDLTPGQWRDFYTDALQVQKGLDDLTLAFDDPVMAALPAFEGGTAVKGSTCGKLSLHIGPDGSVTPCGFIPVPIGNILKDDFDAMWFGSPVLKKLRDKTPEGKCAGCLSYEDCLGGCSARAFALSGSFDSPDPHCWVEEDPSKIQGSKSKGKGSVT